MRRMRGAHLRSLFVMFIRDMKHYRPTPRTIQQAFGPYANFKFQPFTRRRERFWSIVGVMVAGGIFGAMYVWGWM
jgi:hypothetical protein